MNKVLFVFLFFPIIVFCQKKVDRVSMPVKDGSVFYERIVNVDPNLSKNELFLRSSKWIADRFIDSKEAVKLSDKENGKIVGKGLFTLVYNKFGTYDDYVSFDFDVTIKDSRYRVQVYGIETKGIGSNYPFRGIERMYFEQLEKDKYSFRKDDVLVCSRVDAKINELLDDLGRKLSEPIGSDDF